MIDQNLEHFLVRLRLLRLLEQVDVVLDAIFRLASSSNHDSKIVLEEGLPFFIADSLHTTRRRRQVGQIADRELIVVQHVSSNFLAVIITELLDHFIELATRRLIDDVTDLHHQQDSFGATGLQHGNDFISGGNRKVDSQRRLFLGASDLVACLVGDATRFEIELVGLSYGHDVLLKF